MISVLGYATFFLTIGFNYALIALGLNLQWGYTGLFNVGVAGFVAIGAYTSALVTTPPSPQHLAGWGWPVAAGLLAAMATSGITAAFVGKITLRLRADCLAMSTYGVAMTVLAIAQNAQSLTGGPFGVVFIPRLFSGWADRPILFNAAWCLLMMMVTGLVLAALDRLVRSPWGRALKAVREDEVAAASLGKDPERLRIEALVIGAMIMGLAGALLAHFIGFIAPENFLGILTFQVWTMLIIGGSGNNAGAVVGALGVWALWSFGGMAVHAVLPMEFQVRGASLQIVLIGILLAGVLLARPRGLLGERVTISRHITTAFRAKGTFADDPAADR